jgi:ABC transporter substrate binding protein
MENRATDRVRAGHQSQDRPGSWLDDPAVAAGAGGSSDRVNGMDRRRFLLTSLAGAFAAPLAAGAQQRTRIHRIGVLSTADGPEWEAFRLGLRELGYVDGENIVTEYRWHRGEFDRLPNLAAELVALNVALIVVSSPRPTAVAKAATTSIPIIFVSVADPVRWDSCRAFDSPGPNHRIFDLRTRGIRRKGTGATQGGDSHSLTRGRPDQPRQPHASSSPPGHHCRRGGVENADSDSGGPEFQRAGNRFRGRGQRTRGRNERVWGSCARCPTISSPFLDVRLVVCEHGPC